jgi:orotate phosphoribosyltransferase
MSINLKEIYKSENALLQGHFLLSSGKHSEFYLQSAKVLENPKTAEFLAKALAENIQKNLDKNIKIDTVCSPALGGVLIGYELARALGVRFIFTERKNGKMELRRGFEVSENENILICEDIITTGGSALEAGKEVENRGGKVIGFSALANRGFCKRIDGETPTDEAKQSCKLPDNLPLFALEDFIFDVYEPENCPLCETSEAIKPGSRGN